MNIDFFMQNVCNYAVPKKFPMENFEICIGIRRIRNILQFHTSPSVCINLINCGKYGATCMHIRLILTFTMPQIINVYDFFARSPQSTHVEKKTEREYIMQKCIRFLVYLFIIKNRSTLRACECILHTPSL